MKIETKFDIGEHVQYKEFSGENKIGEIRCISFCVDEYHRIIFYKVECVDTGFIFNCDENHIIQKISNDFDFQKNIEKDLREKEEESEKITENSIDDFYIKEIKELKNRIEELEEKVIRYEND